MPSETRLVTIDQKQIADLQAMLGNCSKNFPKAMQAAISRTIKPTGVKMFSDRVKDVINLPVGDIKKQVSVKLPSFNNLVGVITMSRKPVPLMRYLGAAGFKRAQTLKSTVKGKQTRFRRTRAIGGISVKVRKDRPAERYPSAFIAGSTKNAYIGVFQRIKSKSGKKPLVRRYPIRLMQGPTAVGVLAKAPGKGAATILDEIKEALGPILQKNISSQIDRLLRNEKSFK